MVLLGVDTRCRTSSSASCWCSRSGSTALPHAGRSRRMSDGGHARLSSRCATSRFSFGGVSAVDGVDRRPLSRRGGRPARPQRRRQVDADQGPLRRLQCRRAARSCINGEKADIQQPARRQGATASRRSTRRSRSPTTSTPPPTSSSAASSSPRFGTLDEARWRPRPARSWAGSTRTSATSRSR